MHDHRAPDVQDDDPREDQPGSGQHLDRHRPGHEPADSLDVVRAALAWLHGPVTPTQADRIEAEGPVRTWTRIATDPRVVAELDQHKTPKPGRPPALVPQHSAVSSRPDPDPGGSPVARAADGLRVVIPEDPEWPATLTHGEPPSPQQVQLSRERYVPLCLWVRGPARLSEALDRSVAVVGARAVTEYGQDTAEQFAVGLAERGVSVVTTGGYGIDTAAVRGALDADGVPIVVLPCGLDEIHPRGNADLFQRVARQGLLVSAWAPGRTAPTRERLAANGRLVAALARGTVLVEAGHRRGALTTLHHALALNRPAMVVPGPVTSTTFARKHQVLRAHPGTRLVTTADDAVADLEAG